MNRTRMRLFVTPGLVLCLLCAWGCTGGESRVGELTRLADKYKTDKGSALHRYTGVYEAFFRPMKSSARKICEIGVKEGASLRMFEEYFRHAVVYGIDIEDTSRLNSGRIRTFLADQADRKRLAAFVEANGSDFDLILDDGGHTMEQQQVSFAFLFRSVRPGGFYVIEDVHTSLIPGYGVEPGEGNSTLTMIDRFVRSGRIVSAYMTDDEKKYLNDHISYCNLLSRNLGTSITCIFRRRQEGTTSED